MHCILSKEGDDLVGFNATETLKTVDNLCLQNKFCAQLSVLTFTELHVASVTGLQVQDVSSVEFMYLVFIACQVELS